MGMITVEDAMFAQTPNGEIVPGAHLYVYHHGADTLARIFSDSSMIEMQANPMTADEFGQFDKCYTSDGIYRLVMTSPSGASLAIFENVEVQSNESSALTVAQRWASEAEDTVVANGYFSALHYAAKAADAEAATRSVQAAVESALSAAELAAVAAGAKIHSNVASGLTSTSDGEVFLVSETPGMRVYQNAAGSETMLGWLGEVLYDNAAAVLASSETGFAAGTTIRTREGGYEYKVVTSGAHVSTAGGIGLKIQDSAAGPVDIRAFGATGNAADDQDAAAQAAQNSRLEIKFPRNFVLTYSTPLQLQANWIGTDKGNGNPGSATDSAKATYTSELRFTGTGWAVTTNSAFQNFAVRSDGVTVGQNGVRFVNNSVGQRCGPVRVMDFDGTGVEVGDVDAEVGMYFATFMNLSVNNRARVGSKGILIIGNGGVSSSNANIFNGIFVSGLFTTYLHVRGHNNTFLNADVNPDSAGVAAAGGEMAEGVLIEGDVNTFINPYFEPHFDNTGTVVRFTGDATGNKLERMYTPSMGPSPSFFIEDLGTGNEVNISQIQQNFTPSIGVAYSEDNLIPNPGFAAASATDEPYGWNVSTVSASFGFEIDETVKRGGKRTMRFFSTDGRGQASCYFLSSAGAAAQNAAYLYEQKRFAKQTMTVGVWCLSNIAGYGAITVNGGGGSVGTATHSGSGEWEFLTVRTRCSDTPTNVCVTLKHNPLFSNFTTGECWFSEPVAVLGNDVPRYAGTRKLDAERTVMYGSMSWNPAIPLPAADTTPSVSKGSLFSLANASPTTITDFDNGIEGQEILIYSTTANTTLAHNANISTNSGTNKTLAADRVYRLILIGGKWIEVG